MVWYLGLTYYSPIIKVVPVNDIVQQYLNGEWPNFLSIDLEGLDLEVLESADFSKTHPDIICVEITSGDNQKDSDEEMIALLRKKDFFPVFQTGGNIIAVHNSFKNKFAIY